MSEEIYKGAKTKIREQNTFDIYSKGGQKLVQNATHAQGFGGNSSFFAARA